MVAYIVLRFTDSVICLFSSKRAAMVSSTVANMTDGNHLPYINRAQYGGDMRSQSEPSDGVAVKKGGKKRK